METVRASLSGGSPHVVFIYWGRRGLSRFLLDLTSTALTSDSISASVLVSRQNESFADISRFGEGVVPIDTFASNVGALLQVWRVPFIRRQLLQHIAKTRAEVVIELMPHVWSSFIAPAIKAAGVRYVAIAHDAISHPGDYRSNAVKAATRRTLRQADLILTLSNTVAGRLNAMGLAPHSRIFPLFHPDLDFGGRQWREPPQPGKPLRLLFLGRIMAYKGLPLFLDVVDELSRRGWLVEVGVFGEGYLGPSAKRLSAMGAEVINRRLTDAEIGAVLSRFHAVVLSYIEASQSGVASAALGAGLPVIATPVGGIIEQVTDGVTGVLAKRVDCWALADAAEHLASNPSQYRQIQQNIMALREDRSMARFVTECVSLALSCNVSRVP